MDLLALRLLKGRASESLPASFQAWQLGVGLAQGRGRPLPEQASTATYHLPVLLLKPRVK